MTNYDIESPLQYITTIAELIETGDTFGINSLREMYERDVSLEFNPEGMVAVQYVRIILEKLGYNSEAIADYSISTSSEYSRLVFAFQKNMKDAGVQHTELRGIFDKYRIGGESYNAAMGNYQNEQ